MNDNPASDKDRQNDSGTLQDTVRMADRKIRITIAVNLLLIALGSVLIALFLHDMQMHRAAEEQRSSSSAAAQMAVYYLENNSAHADALTRSFHSGNQAVLSDIGLLMSNGMADRIFGSDGRTASDILSEISDRVKLNHMSVMSSDGKILYYPIPALNGTDPVKAGIFTEQERKQLLSGTLNEDGSVTPVSSVFGNVLVYFYSMPFTYKGTEYTLVLGQGAKTFDENISSLRDVSYVLKQKDAGDNGSIFAVDRKNGTFTYYDDGSSVLTGSKVKDCGLSEAALEDGYAGTETINGTDYYCYTKALDDTTAIIAAAKTLMIHSDDRYVLSWSIMAFILVIVVCLIYTVAVREDLMKRAVKTNKKPLKIGARTMYFDTTVFRKVLPLIVFGVLVIFAISFYSQTMLELSDSMERSREAVKKISSKYESSIETRDEIQKYYNEQYIAKANLIAFCLETDPSALNSSSVHRHFYYDKDGNRHLFKDGSGNSIKSVSSSEKLEELCRTNDIESIYVLDDEGRTIGTNTSDWDFTISRDKDDQSSEFLDVLDGKEDSFVQDPKTDDLGEATQYVGASFDYYTKTDENGNTEYVPLDEYKQSGGGDAQIAAHRSMILIGLDAEKTAELQNAADFSLLLSTGILNNGYICMYDSDDEHHCMYSPIRENIGKTASELKLPAKAFSGREYCSLSSSDHRGEMDFYMPDRDLFFETVTARTDIFRNRSVTAFFTALIAFILIVFQCAAVSLTSREEEELFAAESLIHKRSRYFRADPEHTLIIMIRALAGIFTLGVILSAFMAAKDNDGNSMLQFIAEGSWDRGLNFFAFSKAALVILTVAFGIMLLRLPLRLLPSLFGSRGDTIGHLLISTVEYGGALAAVFYCLYLFGLDSSRLIASAGILTLIIGLGAQSLIRDIISGMFIVFEGEFHVGDIVTINGFRGIVKSIGLRTTKVLGIDDEEGNVKIFNNSKISEVLNMTREPSWVACRVCIEYGQDIEYVETVLKRELPAVGEKNPLILTGPKYAGVDSFKESGVELCFQCTCHERNVRSVGRYLNRAVIQLFYDNDINVPFTNITVSQLDTSNRKTMLDIVEDDDTKTSE